MLVVVVVFVDVVFVVESIEVLIITGYKMNHRLPSIWMLCL